MRPSALLSRVRARRQAPGPRLFSPEDEAELDRLAQAETCHRFVPREVTPEEAATLAALSARGEWDRQAKEREATPGVLRDLARRAFVAFRKTRAQPAKVAERVYGARRDGR